MSPHKAASVFTASALSTERSKYTPNHRDNNHEIWSNLVTFHTPAKLRRCKLYSRDLGAWVFCGDNDAVPPDRQPVRFGIFEVDLTEGELRRKGERVKLQEQPFQVLAALLETPGRIVTKEQLQERIWKDDTFVDFDRSLATAINKIRQALGDSASHPRYVETVPRRGYRFLAAGFPARPEASATRPGSVRLAFVWAAGFVVTIAAAAFLLGRIGTDQPPAAFVAQPVTSDRGLEFYPAVSPNGDRVAFVRISDDADDPRFEIWVQTIDSDDDPIRLTSDAQNDWGPTWSPDGNYIAFLRGFPGRSEILRIPSIGGPVKKLGEAFFPAAPISGGVLLSHTFLDWSPDGKFLVVARGATQDQSSPHQLEVATGNTTLLPRPENRGFTDPAYAPDGRSLAYNAPAGAGNSDIWLQDLSERGEPVGEPRRLTQHESFMFGLDWTPDGSEIIFLSRLQGPARFWRVSTKPDEPELVQISGRHGLQLSIDPYSRRFVFTQIANDENIWTLPGPLAQNRGSVVAPKRLVASTRDDQSVHFSPDGERIVFVSNRTGSPELWTSYADGSDLKRVTSLSGPFVGSPNWSPDGQFIAFDGNRDGPFDVYLGNYILESPKPPYLRRLLGLSIRRKLASCIIALPSSSMAASTWLGSPSSGKLTSNSWSISAFVGR